VSEGWRDRAACAGRTSRWWFASPKTDPMAAGLARQICAGCPVRGPCAADALAYLERGGELSGTWAGVYLETPAIGKVRLRGLAAGATSIASPLEQRNGQSRRGVSRPRPGEG
jgi:hypothetical protein